MPLAKNAGKAPNIRSPAPPGGAGVPTELVTRVGHSVEARAGVLLQGSILAYSSVAYIWWRLVSGGWWMMLIMQCSQFFI